MPNPNYYIFFGDDHTHASGSEAVEWMLDNFGAEREEALGVCQLLLDHAYFLSATSSQKSFLDQSYYKFQVLYTLPLVNASQCIVTQGCG